VGRGLRIGARSGADAAFAAKARSFAGCSVAAAAALADDAAADSAEENGLLPGYEVCRRRVRARFAPA
jgi:enediyne biosynthesis protein E2